VKGTGRRQRPLLVVAVVSVLVGGAVAVIAWRETAEPTVGDRSGIAPTSRMLLRGSDADLERDLDLVADSGVKWLRFDFEWWSAEPEQGRFDWSQIDRVVREATRRDLQILGTLAYTPEWARPAGAVDDKAPPERAETFAAFAAAAVRRYAPQGVRHWEVWNEPNIVQFWKPLPDPEAYAELLVAASAAIKAEDPDATVVSAGLAPAADRSDGKYIAPRTFLERLYAAGAGPSFDAVGMHPYAFPYGVDRVAEWNQFQTMPETYDVMVRHGDAAKQIWATEFGAPTGTAEAAVTATEQAAMVRAAWAKWTGWAFTGPMFWYALRDVGTDEADVEDNFGLVHLDFSPKPAAEVFREVMAEEDPRQRDR
jgi:polysaccharide biosynthesis protein PslG